MDRTETVVRAAGGLVRRRGENGVVEVVLVHRPAYDDWAFPKGKLHAGESERDAAVREVQEETGLLCQLEREIGISSCGDARGRPKTVRYREMSPVGVCSHRRTRSTAYAGSPSPTRPPPSPTGGIATFSRNSKRSAVQPGRHNRSENADRCSAFALASAARL